jgi:phenylpropionate dioxygenase-like ring-hydroxylating dioxygenase large terminal subunit
LEIDHIFRTSWLGLGRSDIAQHAGDFIALDIAEQPLLLVRGKDGVLRCFANTCRHRGARLKDGYGQCGGIRCPFHSWSYKLDGNLIAAPHMKEASEFDRADYNLIEYRTAERGGFVFVCLNPNAPEIDEVLGDFLNIHAPWPMETLVTTRRNELTVDCNWKAFLEVFNEYYHLPFVHADSIDDVYMKPEPTDQTTGEYASQFGRTDGTGGLLQTEQQHALPSMPNLTGEAASGVRYTWMFPNMTLAAGTDALWVYEAYPLGPDKCKVIQTACFPPETLETPDIREKIAAYHSRLDAALDEDLVALANQHAGIKAPDAKQGRFHPLLEANVASFANWYATKMTAIETH